MNSFVLVNNPGFGNCAFYAFAIGLINIIKNEYAATGTSKVYTKWKELDPKFIISLEDIIDFKYQKDKNSLFIFNIFGTTKYKNNEKYVLNHMQHSLRKMYYKQESNALKSSIKAHQAHQAHIGDLETDPIFLNTTYQEFLVLVNKFDEYNNKKSPFLIFDKIKQHFQSASSDFASAQVTKLAKNVADQLQTEKKKFLRDKEIVDMPVNQKKELWENYRSRLITNAFCADISNKENSKILATIKKVTKDNFWGSYVHLGKLSEVFKISLKLNATPDLYSFLTNKIFTSNDIRENSLGDIYLNNHANRHWTTNIPRKN